MASHGELKFFKKTGGFAWKYNWLIIGSFLLLTIVLNLFIPQLESTVANKSADFIPNNNPAVISLDKMAKNFNVPASSSATSIIFTDESRINQQDNDYYFRLEKALTDNKNEVAYVIDLYGQKSLSAGAISPDHKSIMLTVMLQGNVGSAKTDKAIKWVRDEINNPSLAKPADLKVNLSGPSPGFNDEMSSVEKSMTLITIISVILITLVLLIVYRSVITPVIPLVSIGVSLVLAKPIVSFLAMLGIIPVSVFTNTLMTAIILGAGTDYGIFTLSRYHEARRNNVEKQEALKIACGKISGILIASGLTIATASASMWFAKIGVFLTTGPAIAVGILVTLGVCLFFTPAVLATLIKFGFVEPRTKEGSHYWGKLAEKLIASPTKYFFSGMAVLIVLALCLLDVHTTYSEPKMQPSNTDFNQGITEQNKHFKYNAMFPEYVTITSDKDMNNTKSLAAVELAATALSNVNGISRVVSVTRPDGKPLKEATWSYQSNAMGDQLKGAANQISNNLPLLQQLASGVNQLGQGASYADTQVPEMINKTKNLIDFANTTLTAAEQSNSFISTNTNGQQSLVTVVQGIQETAKTVLTVLEQNLPISIQALTAFNNFFDKITSPTPNPQCASDGGCMLARNLWTQFNAATKGQAADVVNGVHPIAQTLQGSLNDLTNSKSQLAGIEKNLNSTVNQLIQSSPQELKSQLNNLVTSTKTLSGGLNQLVDGLNQVEVGTNQMQSMIVQLEQGLEKATDYLQTQAKSTPPASGGFYLPPSAFNTQRYIEGGKVLISPDGKSTRLLVFSATDPYGSKAIDRENALLDATKNALRGTVLANSQVYLTGTSSIFYYLKQEIAEEFLIFAIISILAVFLILAFLLRSIVAPLIVMFFVLISFAASCGFTVLVWQYIFHEPIYWAVFTISFMALIAVGSDYSMLFVSRIKEESYESVENGIRTGFKTTGSVITTAGLVFAFTMFALIASGLIDIAEIGFTIGCGLILDILLVRTMLVPATMLMAKKILWWPAKS